MNLLQEPAGVSASAKTAKAKCAEALFSWWQEAQEDPVEIKKKISLKKKVNQTPTVLLELCFSDLLISLPF